MRLFFLLLLIYIPAAHAASPSIVTDDTGAQITLAQPASRIVSLAPHVTEMLFSAGAGDKIVGTVAFSDYPDAAKALPQVGSHQQLDFERILSLQPDLVVGWASGNPQSMQQRLRELQLPLFLSEPRTLEDIASNVERLGALAGTTDQAEKVVQPFRRQVRELRARYATADSVAVFYEVWHQPLMTLNGEHIVSRVIELCGGHNVFAELPTLAPTLSTEAVLAKNPQAIVASGTSDERPAWLDDWKRWPQLRAVRHNHLFAVPPDIIQRHSLRIVDGARLLCEQLEQVRNANQ